MVARKSEDGKTVEFDLVDISGGTEYGHLTVDRTIIVVHGMHANRATSLVLFPKPNGQDFSAAR